MPNTTRSQSGVEEKLKKLLAEKRRRAGALGIAFEAQREAILSPAKYKALLLPRRSGKTYTCMLDVVQKQELFPAQKFCYIALTRPSAENIAWPIIKELDRELQLGCHFQEAKLRVTFPNDATLQLWGCDQKEWIERIRGTKQAACYVDECASYRISLKKLIEEVLEQTLIDLRGELWVIGTPGDTCQGFFHSVTTGKEPGWEQFRWTPEHNPHMREQYLAKVAEKKALNPHIEKDPGFRREYLGEWVEDPSGRVYSLGEVVEDYELDDAHDHYVAAVDFGYKEDCTAFTIAAYSSKHPDFVILESFKREKMLVPDVAEEIQRVQLAYPGVTVVGDPASAQLMDELRSRFNVSIFDAEKTDKFNWIRLYNSDAATGRVKIVRKHCESLIDEQKKLKKLEKYNGQWREHPQQPNDCCDANLYAYRHCYHFRYQPSVDVPKPGTPEHEQKKMDEYWTELSDRAEDEISRHDRGVMDAIRRLK